MILGAHNSVPIRFTDHSTEQCRSRSGAHLNVSSRLHPRLLTCCRIEAHIPTPSPHANQPAAAVPGGGDHVRRSFRICWTRSLHLSQVRNTSDSPRGDARSSRARRPQRRASEGQGPVDREPCRNEAGSGNRARAMPVGEPARAWCSFPLFPTSSGNGSAGPRYRSHPSWFSSLNPVYTG